MRTSLIICSRNRAGQLKKCLDSIKAGEVLENTFEIILVNNGSIDNTEKVMFAFQETCPFSVEVIEESRLGLGIARNTGLAKAKGEVIAFTDDDCYLASDYLTALDSVFDSGSFQYCGGRVLRFDTSDSLYACNESEKAKIFPPYHSLEPGAIAGANMVFQRNVVEKIGLFDPMFGTGTAFRCEDIDYCVRASLAGFTGAYIPDLVVYHHHGRKPGNDIDELEKRDAYARGAYYTKFILKEKRLSIKSSFLKNWITLRFIKERNLLKLTREIKGGFQYFLKKVHS